MNQIFQYNGNSITFQLGNGDVMVNATEMAKAFNKRPNDFLGLSTTNEYIRAITKKNGIADNQLIRIVRGGLNPSTWIHKKLALRFAQWLSVDFSIWIDEKIEELIETGSTSLERGNYSVTPTIPQNYGDALIEAGRLAKENDNQKVVIKEQNQLLITQTPKVLFADSVCASKTSILIGDLAKLLKQNGYDIGQNRLFEWLRSNDYLISRKGDSYNMPTQKSMNLELFEVKETSITHSDGHISINKTTKCTGKGQVYFINKFLKKGGSLFSDSQISYLQHQ